MIGAYFPGQSFPGDSPADWSYAGPGIPLGSVFHEWLGGARHSKDMLVLVRELVRMPEDYYQKDAAMTKG